MPQATPNPILREVDKTGNVGYRELDPQELEAMPLSQFQSYKGAIVNAQSAFFYDTAYVKVGVAVSAAAKQSLFSLGKTEQGAQFSSGTAYALERGEFSTNMTDNGQFPNGINFIMEGAGVQIVMSSDLATTVAENGAITAPNYTASVVISAANNLRMALENLELRFLRGEDVKKRAPLEFWPAPPGVGIEGASGSPNGGFFQNGRGGLVQFTRPVVLGAGDRFQFDLANIAQAAWTPTMGFKVRCVIWGTAIRQQYPG